METQIELEFKGSILKGTLIKESDEFMTVKLSSGYNSNLKKSEVKEIKRIESDKPLSLSNKLKGNNKNLPRIAILHTGGTIASKVDYETGAVSWKFTPEELLALYPELLDVANLDAKMIRNMASDDMRFEHYNLLVDEIKLAINTGVEGVIISHGTDTLHYSAAALSYMLEKLPVPVLIVGAQRSSDRAGSDAPSNLRAAIDFLIFNSNQKDKFNRVGVCMHETISDGGFVILDGINVKKTHTTLRETFKQINYSPFAKVSDSSSIEILRKELLSSPQTSLEYTKFNPSLKIGLMKIHPHSFVEEFDILDFYDGVIIEATGLGHIPITNMDEFTQHHPQILEKIKGVLSKNKKIVIGSQCGSGQICMDVYSPGKILNSVGVLGNRMNLIPETLFMRLAYCLSKKENFDELWSSQLEGFELISLDVELENNNN
jgi:glutamyl-tRNA(Gln) amidotransferase subunit D